MFICGTILKTTKRFLSLSVDYKYFITHFDENPVAIKIMEKTSQLFEVLRSMNKEEFREFGKFVNSPFFNSRSEVSRLYETIRKYHPSINSNDLTAEKLFKKVYPGKKYNDSTMRKLFSLTVNLAVNFFAVSGFRSSEIEYNLKMLDKLREKNLGNLFEKYTKTIEKQFSSTPQTFALYESRFNFTTLKNGYYLHTNENEMINGFQSEIDNFMDYFLSVILLLYIRLSEWAKARNVKFDLRFYDEVLAHIEKFDYSGNALISLYYSMLMLLNTGEEKYFFELQERRKRFEKLISAMDNYNIAVTMMQYCYKKVQQGDTGFRRQQFEVVNVILEENMIPSGNIEPYFFINSVRNASIIGEFSWCGKFIDTYSPRLNKDKLKETLSYSLALTELYRGNYDKALAQIAAINIERSTLKTEFKNMQLVIFYELGYGDELISLIDSYKHFLGRDKDSAEKVKTASMDFIRLVSKTLKYKLDGDAESAALLKQEVKRSGYFNFKEWVLEKLDEIK